MYKQIRVTCRGADSLPIDAIVEFQGALKTITQDNLDKQTGHDYVELDTEI